MSYTITPISYSLHQEDDNPIFGNSVLTVSIDDDAAGAFITISECSDENQGHIRLDLDAVSQLVDLLIKLKVNWQ